MARWKLSRLLFGKEEFRFVEGDEVTLGRGASNTISISSIVVSRNHCTFTFHGNQVLITDLKSSNGIYVGLKKIAANTPYVLKDSDIIGIGWTKGAPVANINDQEKYMFQLSREYVSPLKDRIKFQSDDNIEADIEDLNETKPKLSEISITTSPVISMKQTTKRKIEETSIPIVKEEPHAKNDDNVIDLLSDSESEETRKKKQKLNKVKSETPVTTQAIEPNKVEKYDEYDTFRVKQELLVDNNPIEIASDSDDDDESVQWLIRLSQGSPGKPFTKIGRECKVEQEESCYSQLDDFESNDILDNFIDLRTTADTSNDKIEHTDTTSKTAKFIENINNNNEGDILENLISLQSKPPTTADIVPEKTPVTCTDVVDGTSKLPQVTDTNIVPTLDIQTDKTKNIQIIEPLVQPSRSKSSKRGHDDKHKTSSRRKSKDKHKSHSKIHLSNSQKEERRKKLKDLANKEKEDQEQIVKSPIMSKIDVKAKVTSSNRGAFLTDDKPETSKSVKKTDGSKSSKSKEKTSESSPKNDTLEPMDDIENKKRHGKKSESEPKPSKSKDKIHSPKSRYSNRKAHSADNREPLKSLKPIDESEKSSEKPIPKVKTIAPKKPKKTVRFSDAPPAVRVFEIEEGNRLKKTSLVKMSLVDVRQTPVFSLEKITMMKILRWNPQWLEEQMNNNDPPPILGHNNPTMTIFHSFIDHNQYVQLVGDLLLMEIWECLSQGYVRARGQTTGLPMRIASLPPVPTQDRYYELFNISVNVSVPNTEIRSVPRMGELLIVAFGPDDARTRRFFYVHNVRCLPSPPNNINSFFCISLHSCYTDKMKSLKPGELMVGVSLAYIQNELTLFNAMENLANSPLSEAVLRPNPKHFVKCEYNAKYPLSPWTKTLNQSQLVAVQSSVSAALSDRPCIQMVQGPPGTGKSSVICAIVMTYFYNSQGKRQSNRGKILICATSNAAVDELVCRLLKIRQNLPKAERFRMVRVGRLEAMHPRARDISSQQLAQRDHAARHHDAAPPPPGLAEEISHLEAKINMWKTQEQDAKDPERAAYCKSRVTNLVNRIVMLRSSCGGAGGGKEARAESAAGAERRIVEGADIVVTTLTSAYNYKMQGLRRRIALCIVDEAGQAIEPETLIPLTLDVTKLTLIGDPQQLPGFICSQRAKKHGLGESLFGRLSSCAETWPSGSPVVLLNQQYRMQAAIAEYPNRAFYGGRVSSAPPPRPALPAPPYCLVAIDSGDRGQGVSGANEMEAWGVTRLVLALSSVVRSLNLNLAVITPYNAHKELIKKNLRTLQDPSECPIEVNTVDSFQGQERDVVVVSLARSSGVGFLTDSGRMNVMLTRARHALLVCLNPHATAKNYQWRTLVEDAQKRNLYRNLPHKVCQGPAAGQISHTEVLKHITLSANK